MKWFIRDKRMILTSSLLEKSKNCWENYILWRAIFHSLNAVWSLAKCLGRRAFYIWTLTHSSPAHSDPWWQNQKLHRNLVTLTCRIQPPGWLLGLVLDFPPWLLLLPWVFSFSNPWLLSNPWFSLLPTLGYYSALGFNFFPPLATI